MEQELGRGGISMSGMFGTGMGQGRSSSLEGMKQSWGKAKS